MAQLALFPDQNAAPAGLHYQPEFVSETIEAELISRISELPLQPFQFGAFEGKRRVAWFGFHYDYADRKLREADPIPDWLASIARRVEAFGDLADGALHPFQQSTSVVSQQHAPATAPKKTRSQMCFQTFDPLAHRPMGDVHLLRGVRNSSDERPLRRSETARVEEVCETRGNDSGANR